jgi:hypothetical protein
MEFSLPKFDSEKELLDYIVSNKEDIVYAKKQCFKKADGFAAFVSPVTMKVGANKNQEEDLLSKDSIDVVAVINTTNVLDSHKDVHINGLWDKSLSENKRLKHLKEHQMSFDSIISDKEDLKAYTKEYSWKELGYDAEGKTQALVFESKVRKERNQFMFKQYAKGNVDNHSVGMRYVKIVTCVNDEDYPEEKEQWDKYAPLVVNKADLERTKYFWAVTEAKAIEGSAVPMGSNFITPTQSVKSIEVVANEVTKDIEAEAIKNWLLGE